MYRILEEVVPYLVVSVVFGLIVWVFVGYWIYFGTQQPSGWLSFPGLYFPIVGASVLFICSFFIILNDEIKRRESLPKGNCT